MTECVYAVACHEDEAELCRLEMRALFGSEPRGGYVEGARDIDPGRSPFIRGKLTVFAEAADLERLTERAAAIDTGGRTFKVVFMETDDRFPYERRREIERLVGWRVHGKAEMRRPERQYGGVCAGGRWMLGAYARGEAEWLKHNAKPQPYSTALGTRTARALVNIAAPHIGGVRLVDPCCGIGTVVIEALSMGIDCAGFDINPLAVRGARANLAHFGMPDVVRLADMRELEGEYDAAVVDLPYNLCSVLPAGERLAMLRSARRLARRRAVIVAAEPSLSELEQAGFTVIDRAVARKGRFERHVIVCR
ncbi:TRM11 family SAM-dependent methyltransferase [Paenibacillus humicola]|uniref:TRM11 family SAM-dependent methyltransferase n=1 Tax=Paenibacillus humicola TaxID=3110540 RepID=UPI00237C014E|nr:RsmD family RNA methyltransferase [Paenibacillus humicola]